MKVGVLASGAGTNLQAILDRVHGREGVEVVAVASDQPGAPALDRAARAGVPTGVFPVREDRPARDAAIADFLERQRRRARRAGRLHGAARPGVPRSLPGPRDQRPPALLPAFPGLRAIEQALDYGVKVFGVTVHFVDEGVDTGPVIAQRAIELPDAVDAAAVREALRPLEHDLLCEASP